MDHEPWYADDQVGAGVAISGLDDSTTVDAGPGGTAVDPGPGGTAVAPEPTFGGYSGEYAGIKDAWYSSDGYVYDSGGNRLGTH